MPTKHYTYCPCCATALRVLYQHGHQRPSCPACHYVQFIEAKVAAGVLALKSTDQQTSVLLVQRAFPPQQDKWSLPGGFVDGFEDPKDAARRELLEETGLIVKADELTLFDVYHNPEINEQVAKSGASIFILYQAAKITDQPLAADDAKAARYFALDALPELAFESTAASLQHILKLHVSTDRHSE